MQSSRNRLTGVFTAIGEVAGQSLLNIPAPEIVFFSAKAQVSR
jgi:hypothetical protein